MRLPGKKGLRQGWRWLHSRFVRRALILGYHRIAEPPDDPYGLAVTPERFREQLEALRRLARPIRLDELATRLEAGHLPERAVILTFDDGYHDNLERALPLLEAFEIPAVVFVATGYIGGEFWWDRLARLIMQPSSLPDVGPLLSGPAGRRPQQQKGPASAAYRRELLGLLYARLLPLPYPEQEQALAQLEAEVERSPAAGASGRALSEAELMTLSQSALVDIGAHTVTHPLLADLAREQQQVEIRQSKSALEQLLGEQVTAFSYPNGSATAMTRELVAGAGYAAACSSQSGVVWSATDRYYLPRFWVRNWSGPEFGRWLERWQ